MSFNQLICFSNSLHSHTHIHPITSAGPASETLNLSSYKDAYCVWQTVAQKKKKKTLTLTLTLKKTFEMYPGL